MEQSGYDPQQNALLDDSDKAYQPCYVAPEPDEDSFFDDLSGDEAVEPGSPSVYFGDTPRSPVSIVGPRSGPYTPDTRAGGLRGGDTSRLALADPDSPNDHEYRVEPLLDVTTPAYAPSQTFGSPSVSSMSENEDSNEARERAGTQLSLYQSSSESNRQAHLKSEPKPGLAQDDSDHSAHGSENASREHMHTRSPTPVARRLDPSQEQPASRELFEEYEAVTGADEDDEDDNQLNEDFEGFERDEQPESQVDGIIADIFGESDAEEEFEGFAENEVEKGIDEEEDEGAEGEARGATDDAENASQTRLRAEDSSTKSRSVASDNDDDEDEAGGEEFVSDFDKIMARKREELRRKRRRNRDIEFLNDSDDLIVATIARMREAADEDRQLLAENKPATRKLTMVNEVRNLLRRADLKAALVENGMLSAITEWLSPLPGHTLPNLVIRDTMLSCLREFQSLSTEVLQESGIGKALMYLYKHPRETRENKDKAQRLINEWLRPIFNLTSDYRTLTKEERKQLDYEHLPKRRNIDNENYDHRDINRELDGEGRGLLRPGDPGWIGRARVPQPSNKDYIIRPKWRVRGSGDQDEEGDGEGADEDNRPMISRRRKPGTSSAGGGLGTSSRIQAHIRNLTASARQSQAKVARAVTMSVEGRKMAL